MLLCVSFEVTVTSLHPRRLCRFAVFSVKPSFPVVVDFILSGRPIVKRNTNEKGLNSRSCWVTPHAPGLGLPGKDGTMVPRQVGQERSVREEGARSLSILTPVHNAGPCGRNCCCPLACSSCWCCPPSSGSGPHRFSCCGTRWSTIRRSRCSSRSRLSELASCQRCAHRARSASPFAPLLASGTRRTACPHLARSAGF